MKIVVSKVSGNCVPPKIFENSALENESESRVPPVASASVVPVTVSEKVVQDIVSKISVPKKSLRIVFEQ